MQKYNPQQVEPKWQAIWEKNNTFKSSPDTSKPKFYCLDMFPYPSGAGLHVGHPEGYTATDIVSRYKRANGFNVLHPMGWDAFGLPAEQYAIKTGTHPATTTQKNCDNFRAQIKRIGLSYDWSREINTTDPRYFKWTQWIFKQLYDAWFDEEQQKARPIDKLPIPAEISSQGPEAITAYKAEKRLAYYADAHVWWCNDCKIVCANEEILADGAHEKCGTKNVERKNLKQWLLRIPLYAERLLKGLESLDWPESVKEMQRNWIGKSTGAEVTFQVDGVDESITVFTTRPDTLFGATYMVLSPEHPQVEAIVKDAQKAEVEAYINQSALKSDLDRTDLAKEKTGVFTGAYAINPVNQEKIPIWVADYVLMGYGTGAIMAVPAHDTRDFEFAHHFGIPVICILQPKLGKRPLENISGTLTSKAQWAEILKQPDGKERLHQAILDGQECWTGDGEFIRSNSDSTGLDINGMPKKKGIQNAINWLVENGKGKATTNYKLRDWLFSRQRYWGEPFPVIHWEDGSISLESDENLPLQLPRLENYQPGNSGESPLANATNWLEVTHPESGIKGRRETNTMPQWAGSCWYYLGFTDPNNPDVPWTPEQEKYWMPVDLYIGGTEHAVLHLLYSRFWHHVLYDLHHVSTPEPFQKLFNQGMILAFAYEDARGSKVPSDMVEEKDGKYTHTQSGEELKQIVAKMSKSLKNVVNPDDVINHFGADSLRLYEMFMGPLDKTKPWQTSGLEGQFRFLQKVWRNILGSEDNPKERCQDNAPEPLLKVVHQTIKKVTEDIEGLRFNTAIAQLMIFNNELSKQERLYPDVAKIFIQLLAPFAPHIAEELWERLGATDSITHVEWPKYNPALAKENTIKVVFQTNGKVRAQAEVEKDLPKEELEKFAREEPNIQKYLEEFELVKVIVVPNRLVNFVIKPGK